MATAKPTMNPNVVWARSAAPGNVTPPSQPKIDSGYVFAEKPLHDNFNSKMQQTDNMLVHIQENGVAAWDGVTEYQIGALANFGNMLWEARILNTAKQPDISLVEWRQFTPVIWFETDFEWTVGPGGDFLEMQAAIDELSKFSSIGGKVIIRILAGYVWESPVFTYANLGFVTIIQDAPVNVNASTFPVLGGASQSALEVNGTAPSFDGGKYTLIGENTDQINFIVAKSQLIARNLEINDFTFAGLRGILYLEDIAINGCGTGLYAGSDNHTVISKIRGSRITIDGCDNGMRLQDSSAFMDDLDITNCDVGCRMNAGRLFIKGDVSIFGTTYSMQADHGSTIHSYDAATTLTFAGGTSIPFSTNDYTDPAAVNVIWFTA